MKRTLQIVILFLLVFPGFQGKAEYKYPATEIYSSAVHEMVNSISVDVSEDINAQAFPQQVQVLVSSLPLYMANDSVLICDSKGAYAYHKRFCRGLNNCKARIYKTTKAKAVQMGRRPCGYCY